MQRRSKRILMVLGIIVVVLALTYALLLARATIKLRRAYAALTAAGRPLQTTEIIPPKAPDSDNAAVLYQSAVLLLKGQPVGDKSLYERLTNYRLRPKVKAELNALLVQEAVDKALSLIAQGTQRPACQFEQDNQEVLGFTNLSAMDEMRNLAWIIRSRANMEAEAGHPAQAWDLTLAQLRFADSLRLDPASTSQFTRLTVTRWVSRTIQQLCETALPDPQQCQALDALLARQDNVDLFIRGLDAERLLIGEWFFSLPRDQLDRILWTEAGGGKDGVLPPAFVKAMYRLGFQVVAFRPRLITDHAAYLDQMRKRVELLRGPYCNRKESEQFLEMSHWNILADRLSWRSNYEIYSYREEMADLRMARAGLALLQYRRTHGSFPETLAALGLGELPDPFADQPLHYRPAGEGFIVYSVGEDGKDNGGLPKPERGDPNPRERRKTVAYDEVWRFPAPKEKTAGGN